MPPLQDCRRVLPKTVAHIDPDRTVTFYDAGLPEEIREEIQKIAATSEMSISATQDAPVFSTPPKEPERVQDVEQTVWRGQTKARTYPG